MNLRLKLINFLPIPLRNFLRTNLKISIYFLLRLQSLLINKKESQLPLKGYYYLKIRETCELINANYIEIESNDKSQISNLNCNTNNCLSKSQNLFVLLIPNGRVLYDYGVVVTPNNRLLGDVSPTLGGDIWEHEILFKSKLPNLQKLQGNLAVISSHAHQRYFHWMFDILPRLEILNSRDFNVDFYILNSEKQFQKESIEILNLNMEKIISPQLDTHIMADHLVVPSLPSKISYMTPRSCEFLRTTFMKSFEINYTSDKKIYITRNDALTRRVVNEQEVIEELTKIGFEILALLISGMMFIY